MRAAPPLIVALLAAVAVLGSCRSDKAPSSADVARPGIEALAHEPPPRLDPRVGEVLTFRGACDPSGAVSLGTSRFAVVDDEDNVLRIYDADAGGAALRGIDLQPYLDVRGKHPESDFEAATRIGGVAYWVASHARKSKGRFDSGRMIFLASRLPDLEEPLEIIGEPYRNLQRDLLRYPPLAALGLAHAATLPPKTAGGFNIEGLTATPEGALLLGFRNPVPDGLAIIVPIENPAEIPWGARARFGTPIRLDLDGLGVRALSWWRGRYLIAAGPHDAGRLAIFAWDGPGTAPVLLLDDLQDLHPEAFFTPEDRDDILLLSDDGGVEIDGRPCKKLKDSARKRFRGLRLRPY